MPHWGHSLPTRVLASTYLMGISPGQQGDIQSTQVFPQLVSHKQYLDRFSYQAIKRAEFEKLLSWYALSVEQPDMERFILTYLDRHYSKDPSSGEEVITVLKRWGRDFKIQVDTLSSKKYPLP